MQHDGRVHSGFNIKTQTEIWNWVCDYSTGSCLCSPPSGNIFWSCLYSEPSSPVCFFPAVMHSPTLLLWHCPSFLSACCSVRNNCDIYSWDAVFRYCFCSHMTFFLSNFTHLSIVKSCDTGLLCAKSRSVWEDIMDKKIHKLKPGHSSLTFCLWM